MASSLSKFSRQAIVAGNRVFVSGVTRGLSLAELDETVVFVTLCQGDVLQQARLLPPFGNDWNLGLPAEGFENGAAVATGLVVTPVLGPPFGAAPGGYHTFTWSDTVTVTGAPDTPGAPAVPGESDAPAAPAAPE